MAPSRIDDLRRRVEADPASIAFAQLAEEYRRAGQTEEAVRVSREGLTRHPGYLSARVTLGRALLDLGQLDDARIELQFVASEAPENLAAVRGLAEIFHREGDAAAALEHFQRALALARHDPELEEIVQQLSRQVGAESGPSNGLSFEEAHQELLSAADRLPEIASAPAPEDRPADASGGATAPFDFDTLVNALGTPAAPPLVEAVTRGDTPPVFELPEMPEIAELGGDPFAALEAELRHQVESPAVEAPTAPEPEAPTAWEPEATVEPEAALPVASEAELPEIPEVPAAWPWPQAVPDPPAAPDPDEDRADAVPANELSDTSAVAEIDVVEVVEAVDVVTAEAVAQAPSIDDVPPAMDPGPQDETVPSLSAWTAAMPASAPDDAVEAALATPEPAVADAWSAEADSAPVETSEAPLAAVEAAHDGPDAEGPVSTSLVELPQREGIDTMADQAEPAPITPAGDDDAPGSAPATPRPTTKAPDDGVLDELEDWLNSLQDRSGQ